MRMLNVPEAHMKFNPVYTRLYESHYFTCADPIRVSMG